MAAERRGVPVVLVRPGATVADLSAARARWRVASAPSATHPWDPNAPGAPRWTAELFRARGHRPGAWTAGWDGALSLEDVPAPTDASRQTAAV